LPSKTNTGTRPTEGYLSLELHGDTPKRVTTQHATVFEADTLKGFHPEH
jgi:hypothetical protein